MAISAEPVEQASRSHLLRLATVLASTPALVRRMSPTGGLSLTALATMTALERVDEARVGELADRENVTQPAMTQLLTRLQAQGLVERRIPPDDGRVVLVALTEAGRRLIADHRARRAEALAARLMLLGDDDRAALLAALPAFEHLLAGG